MFNKGDKVISTTGVTGTVIGTGCSKSVYHILVYTGEVIAYDEKFLTKVEEETPKVEKKPTKKTTSKKSKKNDK